MKSLRYLSPLMLSLGMIFVLNACYPGDPVSSSDTDLVATTYADGAQFGKYRTFWVVDSISYIYDSTGTAPARTYEAQILAKVKSEMLKTGYVYKDNPTDQDRPDLVVNVTAFENDHSGYYWYYPGYPWYPGYGGGWGWGYYPGYYPPVGGSYTYTTGTVILHLIDVAEIDTDPGVLLPIKWTGAINGLTSKGTATQIGQRINFALEQAFRQSPYLGPQ